MKILLTQPEIEQILQAHVLDTISLKDGSTPSIKFTATRGDAGVTAEIDIPYMGMGSLDVSTDSTKTPESAPKPGTGRKTAAKSNLFSTATTPTPPEEASDAPAQEAATDAADQASSEDAAPAVKSGATQPLFNS